MTISPALGAPEAHPWDMELLPDNHLLALRLGIRVDAVRTDMVLGLRALAYLRALGEPIGPVIARRRGPKTLYVLLPVGAAHYWPPTLVEPSVRPLGAGTLVILPQLGVPRMRWLHGTHPHDGKPTDPTVLLTALSHAAERLRRAKTPPAGKARADLDEVAERMLTRISDLVPWAHPMLNP